MPSVRIMAKNMRKNPLWQVVLEAYAIRERLEDAGLAVVGHELLGIFGPPCEVLGP